MGRIPVESRSEARTYQYTAATVDELREHMRCFLNERGSISLIAYADVARLFARGAETLGVRVPDLVTQLVERGECIRIPGQRSADLLCSEEYYELGESSRLPDWKNKAVQAYYREKDAAVKSAPVAASPDEDIEGEVAKWLKSYTKK